MNKGTIWAVAVFASIVVAGCGSSSGGAGTTNEHLSEQQNGSCPASPTIVTGKVAEGAACAHASDCLPTCCSCSTGTGQWLAAECLNDKCTAANACADTAQSSFCK